MTIDVKDRVGYLGGSDAAAILGQSPWATPLDTYLQTIGEQPPSDETEVMRWGNVLEDPIAREFTDRTGKKVRRVNRQLQHKEFPFIRAHLDRDVVGESAILEVKTTRWDDGWGEPGSNEVPNHYLCQVTHYMAVTGAKRCYVAVLIGGQDFRIYDVPRNEDLVEIVVAREVQFWCQHVQERKAPDPQNVTEASKAWMAVTGKTAEAGEDELLALADLVTIRKRIASMKKDEDALKLQIQMSLEDADTLIGVDGKPLVTWKESTSNRFDSQSFKKDHPDLHSQYTNESTTRRFLVKKTAEALTND